MTRILALFSFFAFREENVRQIQDFFEGKKTPENESLRNLPRSKVMLREHCAEQWFFLNDSSSALLIRIDFHTRFRFPRVFSFRNRVPDPFHISKSRNAV